MVADPVAIPVTAPVVFTEAMAGSLLLQVPPVAVEVSKVVAPTQTVAPPASVPASGAGFTSSVVVATAVEQAVVAA